MNQTSNPSPEDTAVSSEIGLLTAAIGGEVTDDIEDGREIVDEFGRRLVVWNGHLPKQEMTIAVGPVGGRQPRVRDRRQAPH